MVNNIYLVPGRLRSATDDPVITTNEVYDDNFAKDQETINQEVEENFDIIRQDIAAINEKIDNKDADIESINTKISDNSDAIATIQQAIYTVGNQLQNKLNSIDADITDVNNKIDNTAQRLYELEDVALTNTTLDAIYSDIVDYAHIIEERFKKFGTSTISIHNNISDGTPSDEMIGGDAVLKTGGTSYNNAFAWVRENSILCVGWFDEESQTLKYLPIWKGDKRYLDYNGEQGGLVSDVMSVMGVEEYDIFMKLPEFYWRMTQDDDDSEKWYFTIAIPNYFGENERGNEGWQHWAGDTFIGVYNGNDTDGRLRSISGDFRPIGYKGSWETIRALARERGNGYSLTTYDVHKMLCLLFWSYYGDTDRRVLPNSYANPNHDVGDLDGLGFIDGGSGLGLSYGVYGSNFWGIENAWSRAELIDDLILADNSKTINVLNSEWTSENGYKKSDVSNNLAAHNIIRQIDISDTDDKLVFGTFADVICKKAENNIGTNFVDYISCITPYSDTTGYTFSRGATGTNDSGVATFRLSNKYDYDGFYLGYRLQYKGNHIEQFYDKIHIDLKHE